MNLTHLLLDCSASEPLWRAIFGTTTSIFDLWSRCWGVAPLLGLRGIPHAPIPRKGSGSTTTTTKRFYWRIYASENIPTNARSKSSFLKNTHDLFYVYENYTVEGQQLEEGLSFQSS